MCYKKHLLWLHEIMHVKVFHYKKCSLNVSGYGGGYFEIKEMETKSQVTQPMPYQVGRLSWSFWPCNPLWVLLDSAFVLGGGETGSDSHQCRVERWKPGRGNGLCKNLLENHSQSLKSHRTSALPMGPQSQLTESRTLFIFAWGYTAFAQKVSHIPAPYFPLKSQSQLQSQRVSKLSIELSFLVKLNLISQYFLSASIHTSGWLL